ncbi:MAG: 1-acyl-sn-glycerol-3-phosphate acyltransferase [Anaerolineales bacterium]|nr:1-acyl-sn-glycerol-3-phosphate acyltransferase [Anaerolineales bacterium]
MSLSRSSITLKTLDLIFGRATRKFSKLSLGLDHEIEHHGPSAGLRWFLPNFVAGYFAQGQEIIPKDGPLLIVSNHPASYDALVISSFINRPDYKISIGEIPPYRYLPHISQHAIFSPPVKNTFGRMQTVRNIVKHLNADGAVLIFPRGGIEPDPAFMPNPGAEFDKWSHSLEIFLRRVPRTRVLVTTVSGVISPKAMRHPITWFRKARRDRQRLAFIYQMIRQILSGKELYGLTPRVTFGEVLSSANHEHILTEVERSARRTLARHMDWSS